MYFNDSSLYQSTKTILFVNSGLRYCFVEPGNERFINIESDFKMKASDKCPRLLQGFLTPIPFET